LCKYGKFSFRTYSLGGGGGVGEEERRGEDNFGPMAKLSRGIFADIAPSGRNWYTAWRNMLSASQIRRIRQTSNKCEADSFSRHVAPLVVIRLHVPVPKVRESILFFIEQSIANLHVAWCKSNERQRSDIRYGVKRSNCQIHSYFRNVDYWNFVSYIVVASCG
jgi:hypothetical protein